MAASRLLRAWWTGVALALVVPPVPACGPWFPSSYLEGGAGTMSPYVDFAFALLDIAAALPPGGICISSWISQRRNQQSS